MPESAVMQAALAKVLATYSPAERADIELGFREGWDAQAGAAIAALTEIAEMADRSTAREASSPKTQQGDCLFVIGRKARAALPR